MTYDFLIKIVLRWLLIAELGKEKAFTLGSENMVKILMSSSKDSCTMVKQTGSAL